MSERPDLNDVDTVRLSQLFEADATPEALWSEDEIGAVFQHQLAAPLAHDLADLNPDVAARLAAWKDETAGALDTFADLFRHPRPPLPLLELVKQFAKLSGESQVRFPRDVAAVLYTLAISAAIVRCGQRITTLDDPSLKSPIDRATSPNWIGDELRALLTQAAAALHASL